MLPYSDGQYLVCPVCIKTKTRQREIEEKRKQKESEEQRIQREIEEQRIQREIEEKRKQREIKERQQQRKQQINAELQKFSGDAYTVLYKYVEKHYSNYPNDEQEKLIKLLNTKYKIGISKEDLLEVQYLIENKIEELKKLQELEDFERELLGEKKDSNRKEMGQQKYYCSICNELIDNNMYEFTKTQLGKPLCKKHQGTRYQRMLFEALKGRGINCEFEFYDGFKHVDIAIPQAKLYIEIDGSHHSTDATQLSKDLKRDELSNKDGYRTKHYTNKELAENFTKIVDALVEVITEG